MLVFIKQKYNMTLNSKIKLLSLLIFSIFFTTLFSQNIEVEKIYNEIYHKTQSIYGIDLELVSGVIYKNKRNITIGHSFFFEPQFYKGELVFRGKLYNNIEFIYDLFKQQILIKYAIDSNKIWLFLPYEFTSEFSFNTFLIT